MSDKRPAFIGHKLSPTSRIGIVRSIWHGELTKQMEDDAATLLLAAGLREENLFRVGAPGSYEIPLLCKELIHHQKLDGVIAFGVIVQGATHHARLIAESATHALMSLQLETGVPIIDEILFVDDIEDAAARSTGDHAKGPLAARTLLHSLALLTELRS